MIVTTGLNKKNYTHTHHPDVLFYVFEYVRQNHKLPNIGRIERQVKQLKDNGLIYRKGYSVWDIGNKYNDFAMWDSARKELHTYTHDTPLRGHGNIYKVIIPKVPNWIKREQYLIRNKIDYLKISQGHRLILQGFKVWLCDKSIIIYCPDYKYYWCKIANTGKEQGIITAKRILAHLEAILGVDLKINKEYSIKIVKQHFGRINDVFAKEINNLGKQFKCSLNGKDWFIVDNSKGYNEAETIDPITAPLDMDRIYAATLNDLKVSYDKTGILPTFSNVNNRIDRVEKVLESYAINIESHIGVLKELDNKMKQLTLKDIFKSPK